MKFLHCCLVLALFAGCARDHDSVKKLVRQALEYEDKGELDNAIKTHQKIVAINPDNYASANSISGLYGKMGKYGDEITWAKKAIRINPQFPLSYINLGNGFLGQGDLSKAEEYYREAEALDHNSPLPPYSLGVVAESKGDLVSAIDYYRQSLSRDSTFENGYYNLAAAYANLNDFERAEKNILKALTLNPGSAEAKEMHEQIRQELTRLK